MTIQRTFRVLASASLLLALAACGGGGNESAAGAAGGGGSNTQSVAIQDNAFTPADVSVSAGSSVAWTNNDDVPHTVTFSDSSVESSDELAKGDDFSTDFAEAGEYSYVCAIHPDMKGKVTVS